MEQHNYTICHITTAHPPFDVRIFQKECRTLAEYGYNVTLIAQHPQRELKNDVTILPLQSPHSRFLRMIMLPWIAFSKTFSVRADIYHFHDPELIPVGIVLKLIGMRVIYDVHEDYAKQTYSKNYLPKQLRGIIASLVKSFEYVGGILFDGIVAATDSIRKNFTAKPTVISLCNFPTLRTIPENRVRKNGDPFRIIYIGMISHIRGVEQCVRSLELLSNHANIRFDIYGAFDSRSFKDELLLRIKQDSRITWHNPIPHDDVPALLKYADVGLVCFLPEPNHTEALPTKMFEYMSASLPVIASNFPLWAGIIEKNKCGLCIDPTNSQSIADAIKYLIERPDLRYTMGRNGRFMVEQHYSWEHEKQKLLTLYRHILKGEKKS